MDDHEHTFPTQRMAAFSDGVFAIIITLLVLELRVPELEKMTSQDAWSALIRLSPEFLSFAFSFFILCIFWGNHHQLFYAIKHSDRKLLWYNNFLLFWLCFIPFPTAFLGRYPTNMVAVMLFGAALFLAASAFSIMTYYLLLKSNLFDDHVPMKERIRLQRQSYWGVSLYALSVILAPVSIYISFFIFILVPVIYFIPHKIGFTQ